MEGGRNLEIDSPKGHLLVRVPHTADPRPLTDILERAGLALNTRCGQRGLCDGCIVELLAGSVQPLAGGQIVSATDEPALIRACQHHLAGQNSAHLRLSARSLLAYQPQVVTDFSINVPYAHSPLFQCIALPWGEAFGEKPANDGLCRAVARQLADERPVRMTPGAALELNALEDLPLNAAIECNLYATFNYQVDHWLITRVALSPDDRPFGMAIDVGTTTVVLLLVDLTDGRIFAKCASFNQQMHLGDDVVTRITLCTQKPEMLRKLQEAVAVHTIAPLLRQALDEAAVDPEQVVCGTIAGNTTMLHLLAGIDPSTMGVAPFTPVFLDHRILPAAEIFHPSSDSTQDSALSTPPMPGAAFHLLPSAAAYIGSDITAGVIASGLLYDDGPSLLVDVGTNGEIILKHGKQLLGCATAAGPAFEGAGLSCGIRAGDGAISHVELGREPFHLRYTVIGHEHYPVADPPIAPPPHLPTTASAPHRILRPAGLCGSAYVDFLSQARSTGLLNAAGRFNREAFPAASIHLMPWNGSDLAFRLAHGEHKRPIVISQTDISHLLQAKAAIAAGILILLGQARLTVEQIKTVYLAGGFGTHMNTAHAIGCGLLPGFRQEQVRAVGNTALAGAYIALLDSSVMEELAHVRRQMRIVELNLDPGFEGTYIDQLMLP
jgi:uncharacterized 2Fe-2S/4Fe-4S cluster protein (DUF4445 family)